MRVLGRVLLFLLVLALLVGLVMVVSALVPVPWLSDFTRQAVRMLPWLSIVFAAVLLLFALVCVLALVLLASVPTRRRLYVLRRNEGRIEIERHSIERAIGGMLEEIGGVRRYRVQLRGQPSPRKLRVRLQVQPRDTMVDLGPLGQEIQTRLTSGLAESLAVEPKHVRVKIQPVGEDKHAKVPRVV